MLAAQLSASCLIHLALVTVNMMVWLRNCRYPELKASLPSPSMSLLGLSQSVPTCYSTLLFSPSAFPPPHLFLLYSLHSFQADDVTPIADRFQTPAPI